MRISVGANMFGTPVQVEGEVLAWGQSFEVIDYTDTGQRQYLQFPCVTLLVADGSVLVMPLKTKYGASVVKVLPETLPPVPPMPPI